MEYLYIVKAIHKLRPKAEFSFTDGDYSTIKWDVLEGNPPTQNEINEVIEQIKTKEAQDELDAIAKKQVSLAKLEALGLDVDDLKALGLG